MFDLNRLRYYHLLDETKEQFKLNLSGVKVITEAANGYYSAPVLLAALAGAEVVAVGKDSSYASFEQVKAEIEKHAIQLRLSDKIYLTDNRFDQALIGGDIVTNLNFVRPLDQQLLEHIGSQTIVCYMCENWEVRPGDVDFVFCDKHNIPIYFSDEDSKHGHLFPMAGLVALKLIFESGAGLADDRVAILSSDRFGPVIKSIVKKYAYKTKLFRAPDYDGYEKNRWDLVIVAEYAQAEQIIGQLMPTERLLSQLTPGATLIQFAGNNNLEQLKQQQFNIFPPDPLPPLKMARTFGYLGPRPIVMYNAIGLKVGQTAVEGKKKNLSGSELDQYVVNHAPAQLMVKNEM